MTELHKANITLTKGQKERLAKAYKASEEITLRLKHKALTGNNELTVSMQTKKKP